MQMNVLVLAAGKSTRIAGISGGLPKPLLKVGDRAVIEHNFEWLAQEGITDAWVNLHYRPEDIRASLGSGSRFGIRIQYSHEDEILGTAGAWKRVAQHALGPWLVVYGDNLLRFDLSAMADAHQRTGAKATVALFDRDVHQHTGIAGGRVELHDDGRIRRFVEGVTDGSDASPLVNAGVYLLEHSVEQRIPAGFQDFGRDIFPRMVDSGEIYGHVLEPSGFCLGLDTPESFTVAQRLVKSHEVNLK